MRDSIQFHSKWIELNLLPERVFERNIYIYRKAYKLYVFNIQSNEINDRLRLTSNFYFFLIFFLSLNPSRFIFLSLSRDLDQIRD